MRRALLTLAFALIASPVGAQWTNRYPLLDGYRHHVYLEGYELPTMNVGPTDPAVSPDGTRVAFSARGWIWMLDLASGRARRITDGAAMDFRPAWSADGTRVAFVRDDSRDTRVVVRDLTDGTERVVDTDAIDMDPVFAVDGTLVYVSASGGAFDLWSDDGRKLTDRPGLVVSPSLSADGGTLVYLHKRDGDRIVARDRATAGELVLATGRILSQTRPAVSPDGRLVAYNVPTQDGYELRLVSTTDPGTTVRLTTGLRGLPLSPAWSPDGAWVWYTEADADEVMRLYRVPAVGGRPEEVFVRAWDWGADVGVLRVTTRRAATRRAASGGALEGSSPVPTAARLAVVDGSGHPAVPGSTQPRVGGQDGRVFFYSPGVVDVVVPVGEARVSAVRGLATPEVSATVSVRAGRTSEVTLDFEPVWDAAAEGYLSGDHHFHLNYGGAYALEPADLAPMMEAEELDVATPVLANLHNRFEEQHLWGWSQAGDTPLIRFAQEVRSHLLGHVSLLATRTLFWPWIWGPGYQVYGLDDRANAEPLGHARAQGGLGGYVHPISDRDPFAPESPRSPGGRWHPRNHGLAGGRVPLVRRDRNRGDVVSLPESRRPGGAGSRH